MANPTLPSLSDAAGSALSDTIHAGTGIRHIKEGAKKTDTPKLFTRLKETEKNAWDVLASCMQGLCVSLQSGLNVGAYALTYMIGSTRYDYAGSASFACTASATNYLYLTATATLLNSTTGWPAGDHFKVAIVTTNATTVTGVTDARWMNFQVGTISNWWTIAPTAVININGQSLDGVGRIDFAQPVELTLDVNGNVNPTATFHSIDTYLDAAADDLLTLNNGTINSSSYGKLLIIKPENAARVVTVKHGSGINLWGGQDFVLDSTGKFIVLLETFTGWMQIGGSNLVVKQLTTDLDANTKNITNVAKLAFKANATLTIGNGAITVTQGWHDLATEGAAATDDLDTISGGANGQLLFLQVRYASKTITVKHQGIGNILLAHGRDHVMDDINQVLALIHDGTNWNEIARSEWKLSDLIGTGKHLPLALQAFAPGGLSNNQVIYDCEMVTACTVRAARGRVQTAPVTTSCIIDVLKNGASIFAADANRINIAAGTFADTSDTVSATFAVGDQLTVKVLTASSAAGASVMLDAVAEAIS
ncbi:MAG: hypothetical protein AABZ12_03635 [Planctomycetota bacterium]